MSLTLVFAVLAGCGAGAAWGYRTALYVALGKMGPTVPAAPAAQRTQLPAVVQGGGAR